ncbi:efflux transporter outer membrane subunit [Sphingobium olei]|uniref:Efflux transporter outer membrane subunit n=1 Tax=Sphingobium olei TaxID=420955 RepID=A0ABW3NZK8_9SPHN
MKTRLVTSGLFLALSACVGARPPLPPAAMMTPPAQWREDRDMPEAGIDAQWWRAFGDEELAQLVDEALARNEDIEIAAARIEEARAQFAAARGARLPAVQGVGAGGRTRSVNPFGIDVDQWAAQTEVQASFDLDLFGRLKNSAAAARAQLLATEYGRDTIQLAIMTAVTGGYVQLRTFDERLAVLRRTLEARGSTLRLIRRRAEAGYGSQLDLAQAEAEYEATAQAVPPVELAITKLENGLSILLGRIPGPVTRGATLNALTIPDVPVQLPASVLRHRPDLASAEQQIVAADHSLDAARAAFMPNISLSASGGFVASSLLPDNPLSIFSLGGSILAPIFNGGRLRAQAESAAARRDQAAFAYRRAALTAFREVEDSMASVARLGEQEQVLRRQQAALARVHGLASRRYQEGYSPYLEQLDAERSLLSAELSLIQSRGDRLLAAITLFQTLGGGWQPELQTKAASRGTKDMQRIAMTPIAGGPKKGPFTSTRSER